MGNAFWNAYPMSGLFQNIDPPPPHRLAWRVCTPAFGAGGGEDKLGGWRAGGGSIVREDARHCSVLYICKYLVLQRYMQMDIGH
jgi:hypothetical protein